MIIHFSEYTIEYQVYNKVIDLEVLFNKKEMILLYPSDECSNYKESFWKTQYHLDYLIFHTIPFFYVEAAQEKVVILATEHNAPVKTPQLASIVEKDLSILKIILVAGGLQRKEEIPAMIVFIIILKIQAGSLVGIGKM